MPKVGTKNALFGHFGAIILKKLLSYLKSAPLNQNFGPKMPYLGIFGQGFEKNYFHICNQHPQIYLIAKFRGKTKMPKFGTKNALFACFWVVILKQYCHISNQHVRICLIATFRGKTKMPKFGTKNVLLGIFEKKCLIWVFLDWNCKRLLSFLKSTHSNFSKMSLEFIQWIYL